MKNITITAPTPDDIETLFRWGEDNWQMWGDEKNKWFPKQILKRWILDPEDDVLLIARMEKKPIGMCMTGVIRDWAFCLGFFVEEQYRNQGIGKKLLHMTYELLKEKQVASVILLVDTKNDRAKKLYEQEGFYPGFTFYMMTKEIT